MIGFGDQVVDALFVVDPEFTVEVNMAKTELDRYCDDNLIGRAADLLPALYQFAFDESIDLT